MAFNLDDVEHLTGMGGVGNEAQRLGFQHLFKGELAGPHARLVSIARDEFHS